MSRLTKHRSTAWRNVRTEDENCGKHKERLDDSLEVKGTSFVTKQCRCGGEVFELLRILYGICSFSLKGANEFLKKGNKSSKKCLYLFTGNFKFKRIFNVNKENLLLFFFLISSSACRNFRPFYFKNTNLKKKKRKLCDLSIFRLAEDTRWYSFQPVIFSIYEPYS